MAFLDKILPDFYYSAEQADNWCQVLDRIKTEMQMASVVVQLLQRNGDQLSHVWQVRDSESTAHAQLHDALVNNEHNPRMKISNISKPLAESYINQDEPDVTASNQEFQSLRERLHTIGLGRPLMLDIRYSNVQYLSLIMHSHSDDARPFAQKQIDFLRHLSPHLKQTVSLAQKMGQIQQQSSLLAHTLDQFSAGLVITDISGQIYHFNEAAKQIIGRSKHLQLHGQRLRCHSLAEQQILNDLVQQALCSTNQRFIAKIGSDWDDPVQVLALRFCGAAMTPGLGSARPYVVLYLAERQSQFDLSAEEIVSLFGLTNAEARLAIALSNGQSVTDHAQCQGIAVGTVRIQLKSVFCKLGINRQPELVQLIASSIAASTLGHVG